METRDVWEGKKPRRGKTTFTWLPRCLRIQRLHETTRPQVLLPPTNGHVWQVLSGGRRVLYPLPTRTYLGK